MRSSGWWSVLRLVILTLFLPLAWGCFDYEEVITISDDGSGTVEITASIDKALADRYVDVTQYPEGPPPPVTSGIIRQSLMIGSANVKVEDVNVELKDDRWQYRVALTFSDIESLAKVTYFRPRSLKLTWEGGKRLVFGQLLKPTLVALAASQAKTATEHPYSQAFLLAVAAPDFYTENVIRSTCNYEVVLPGIKAMSPNGRISTRSNELVSVRWEFTAGDLKNTDSTPSLRVTSTLPAEKGFMPLVIVILLASVVGVLIPAIRLLVLKMRGTS